MRNRSMMTWRAGAATLALAAATLFVGTSPVSAQMHTEVIGEPIVGASQADRGYDEAGLTEVRQDDGGPSLSRGGRDAGLLGPACTFEIAGRGPGYDEAFNEEVCGIGGRHVEHHGDGGDVAYPGDGRADAHYP
jgi:hypothetical protein